jgi:hypothetical protein
MATSVTGDIWHLSIDDLLAPIPETPRLGGPGPFVINLSASTAPISLPGKGSLEFENAHVYQLQRTEDRRLRYRLRLGPFVTEDQAEAILGKVRDLYPGALTATADADDLRAIAALQPKVRAAAPTKLEPPVLTAEASKKLEPPTVKTPAATPVETRVPVLESVVTAARGESTNSTSKLSPLPPPSIPVLTTVVPAAPSPSAVVRAVRRAPATTPQPTPAAAMSVPKQAPRAPVAPKIAAGALPLRVVKPSAPATVMSAATMTPQPAASPAARAPTPPTVQPRLQQLSQSLPNLELTQTLRPLTPLELQDPSGAHWFAIQLSASEDYFDPDSLPNLDIFNVYRLYAVTGVDQGRVVHALRLGFFSEDLAARAVASYLAAYYENPTVKRVSNAERERFSDQKVEARKDIGATGRHATIEITGDRLARRPITGVVTGIGGATSPPPMAKGR